jgi:sodium-dependent dicarboxylate transporter 2/3/5
MRKRTIAFILSLGSAIALTLFLKEPQFSDSQTYVLFLLFFSIGLWLTEAIPSFAVGLFIIAFLVFSLGNKWFNSEPQDIGKYANTFSSSVIWLMMGGFFLATALTKTGIDGDLLKFTLRVSGATPKRILMGLMLTTMIASMLMSNTATTAMVIAAVTPLLTNLGRKSTFTKALLLGVPLAASVGGMGTIIGSPPNLIAAGALENAGITIDFLHWMLYGLPLAIVITTVGYFLLTKLYVKDNQPISVEFLGKGDVETTAGDLRSKRKIVMVVLLATLVLWMTSSMHHLSVAAVAAIPIVFLPMTGVMGNSEVRGLPWDTLLLVAGGLSLGLSLQDTGLLSHYAGKIVTMQLDPLTLLCLFAFISMLFSTVMSHTATSALLVPLGMAILPEYKIQISLITGLAVSTAMLLPVSTPPNAIAYSTGFLDLKDFRIVGSIIGLLGPILVVLWVLAIG